jgi:predicted transposase YbfD/YdcC
MGTSPLSLKKHFATLRDPRLRRRRRHELLDIITIAICAVIGNADTWPDIVTFAKSHRTWLKRFLPLTNGIPSHDTFERVFDLLDPQAFARCFLNWTDSLFAHLGLKQIAIDGKTLRGSRKDGLGALHLVSAWASKNHLSLGQVAVNEKSNEITAIPKLLELLDLKGALVTIDAMGCQKDIARKIVAGGGDYLLTVKSNQETLLNDLQDAFEKALETDFAGLDHDTYETNEYAHGRLERRLYTVIQDPGNLSQAASWTNLRVIGMCCSERNINGNVSSEVRFFIGSKRAKARFYGKALRNHWGIENGLHWHLDVSFNEDHNRTQKRHAAENLSSLRRLALMLLKKNASKESIARKRYRASMDEIFLEQVLQG